MNRRLKAFWTKHEGWLGPATVVLALGVGFQVGATSTRAEVTKRLTDSFTAIIDAKDLRIRELHERANSSKENLLPAVDAAVEAAKAAARSADASAKTVEKMANEKGDPKAP